MPLCMYVVMALLLAVESPFWGSSKHAGERWTFGCDHVGWADLIQIACRLTYTRYTYKTRLTSHFPRLNRWITLKAFCNTTFYYIFVIKMWNQLNLWTINRCLRLFVSMWCERVAMLWSGAGCILPALPSEAKKNFRRSGIGILHLQAKIFGITLWLID